jgi:hypothetical protein
MVEDNSVREEHKEHIGFKVKLIYHFSGPETMDYLSVDYLSVS